MRNDGGSAFPIYPRLTGVGASNQIENVLGMSLRDYFAARALMEAPRYIDCYAGGDEEEFIRRWAAAAYKVADAMLDEKAKESVE